MIDDSNCDGSGYQLCKSREAQTINDGSCVWLRQKGKKLQLPSNCTQGIFTLHVNWIDRIFLF